MNILIIKIGKYFETDYREYVFKTNLKHTEIYNSDLKFKPNFLKWLENNHYDYLIQGYNTCKYFDIDFYYDDNLNEIKL